MAAQPERTPSDRVGGNMTMLAAKTNGELLKQALDALDELLRRGNRSLEHAQSDVTFQYERYLGLRSLASAMEAAAIMRADMYDELDPGDCAP